MKYKFLKVIAFLFLAKLCAFGVVVIDNPSSGTMNINVSETSVNRLVLPSKIIDIAYSKEKGLEIQINENQAFIKYAPTKKEKIKVVGNQSEIIGDPEIVYNAKGAEVFFITTSGNILFCAKSKEY